MRLLISDWSTNPDHPDTPRARLEKNPRLRLETLCFSDGSALDAGQEAVDGFKARFGSTLDRGLSVHGPYVDLCPSSCDRAVRQAAWNRFHAAWEIAGSLGAESIVFHSDWKPAPYGFGNWIENAAAFWRAFLAEHPGLRIYVENVYDADWKPLAELADSVLGLGLCLDVGHAHVHSRIPMEDWIIGLGDRIGHFHFHNNNGKSDDHHGFFHVPEGGMDMKSIFRLAEERLPDADAVLEIPWPDELGETLTWVLAEKSIFAGEL